jgi:hypothetical protein
MKHSVITFSLSLLLLSCIGKSEESIIEVVNNDEFNDKIEAQNMKEVKQTVNLPEDLYSLKTTFSPENGWGYQILNNGELYINQPHMPSVPGNEGFDSEEKATTTGEYIIYKLDNGFFPPTISPEELDSLGVM